MKCGNSQAGSRFSHYIVLGFASVMTGADSRVADASSTDCLSYGYACTPGYTGANTSGTWAWNHYGGNSASTPDGSHNCTLYAAWRLQQSGLTQDPGNWGNAVDWAAHIGGDDHNPIVGSIAWYGATSTNSFGHVAYVEQVSGSNVYIRADNFSSSNGYTDAGWVTAASVGLFLHPHDVGGSGSTPGESSFIHIAGQSEVYRIAGGAPTYVSSWNAFGGPQPLTSVSRAQFDALRAVPADGTFVFASGRGDVYRIAGGAPVYVSGWAAFGGPQPAVGIDPWDIDNINDPHTHLRAVPADGTTLTVAENASVYRVAGGAPIQLSSCSAGCASPVMVNQSSIDSLNHLRAVPADGTVVLTVPSVLRR